MNKSTFLAENIYRGEKRIKQYMLSRENQRAIGRNKEKDREKSRTSIHESQMTEKASDEEQ